ncbi:NUDIX domain-containing protein [Halomonas sp. THAF12]|uniref:NUDIX domain-containing protein n=1 Tax=Halomonas sp. B23F22_10 TaxID=3459515 RepID=UPI00373DFCC8
MPRELALLRHGKSDWSVPVGDLERPLKKRGKLGAQRMGAWLAEQGWVAQRILTSPAERALATAEKCAKAMGLTRDVVTVEPSLYEAGPEALAAVVRRCPEDISRLMVVGHNPGLEAFLDWLLPASPAVPDDGKVLPTAAMARLLLDDDWAALDAGGARLVEIRRVRALPEGFAYPFPDGAERRERPAYYYTQSAVLPYRWRAGALELLLIGSSSNRHWSLPKGIVEPGLSPEDSALREAGEEAGVSGAIAAVAPGRYRQAKWGASCEVTLFAMHVEAEQPEHARAEPHRARRWCSPEQAAESVKNEALRRELRAMAARIAAEGAP